MKILVERLGFESWMCQLLTRDPGVLISQAMNEDPPPHRRAAVKAPCVDVAPARLPQRGVHLPPAHRGYLDTSLLLLTRGVSVSFSRA